MNKYIMVFLVAGIFFSACNNPSDVEDNFNKENDLTDWEYPLKVGYEWGYNATHYDTIIDQVDRIDTNMVLTILDSTVVLDSNSNEQVVKFTNTPFWRNYNSYIYGKSDGVYICGTPNGNEKNEVKIINFPITKNDKFIGYERPFQWGIGNMNELSSGHFTEREVIALDTIITVKAGSFSCIQIRKTWEHDSYGTPFIDNMFFSSEVGLVKFEETRFVVNNNKVQKCYVQELVNYNIN